MLCYIGSFIVKDYIAYGEINETKYIISFTQAISTNVTDGEKFLNEKIDEKFNYYVSIPLTFESCPFGYIYTFLEDK